MFAFDLHTYMMSSEDHQDYLCPPYGEVRNTLMQFTGIQDSQGKDVYEGDIVDFTYWWLDGNVAESHLTGEVVYLPECMSYGLRGVKNADWIHHIGGEEGSSDTAPFATWTFEEANFEIIGNIYQNSELIVE